MTLIHNLKVLNNSASLLCQIINKKICLPQVRLELLLQHIVVRSGRIQRLKWSRLGWPSGGWKSLRPIEERAKRRRNRRRNKITYTPMYMWWLMWSKLLKFFLHILWSNWNLHNNIFRKRKNSFQKWLVCRKSIPWKTPYEFISPAVLAITSQNFILD